MLSELTAVLAADWPSQDDAAELTGLLYTRSYTRSVLDVPTGSAAAPRDLSADLAAANQSRSRWWKGWRVEQVLDDGRIVAARNGAERAFLPGEYVAYRGIGTGLAKGEPISVFSAAGSSEIQPAFYYAFGEAVADFEWTGATLRIYWNVQPEGAPRLMAAVTREFNRYQIPFRFKCLNAASSFPRRDAAVLYFDRRHYRLAALLVESIHREVLPWLSPGTPLFTKPLAPGMALAEDPGASFGMHRCAILAEAMAASPGKPVEERLAELRRCFAERGLCFDSPWLNANSAETYDYPIESP
ncbi:MAG TPA: T3SS effector HopA1 family protein [Bryobacteraceae bacterium]|nr:T3SS effector HopA1 family protein [Bryobacteraceae bacterium]